MKEPTTTDMRPELYGSYNDWKGWTGAGKGRLADVYAFELARATVPVRADILEIGFGDGEFLDFCRDVGHRIVGVEIIPEFVSRASARGHIVYLTGIGAEVLPCDGQFDLVAAFDVFEHLTVPELLVLLRVIRERLRPAGKVLARFPNGGSPLSVLHQHGDLTHRTYLSATAIEQIAQATGLRLRMAANAARPLEAGRRARLVKRAAYLTRDVVENIVGLIYYGRRVPLDPNLTVVLEPLDASVSP